VRIAPHRCRSLLQVALGAALLAVTAAASACGLEDADSIAMRRGALNMAYPEALHVGTAVWQAQLAGRLARDPLAQRGDLTPEARAKLRLIKANASLGQLALRMSQRSTVEARPKLAIVLLGPVLWSRFEASSGSVRPTVHVEGPEGGDVVVVTDIAVVEAIAGGSLGFAEAIDLGVVRLYGPAQDVAAARSWLVDIAPG
jgi:hypothetical protein